MKKGTVAVVLFAAAFFSAFSAYASDVDVEKDLQKELQESRTLIEKMLDNVKSGRLITAELEEFRGLTENIAASHLLLKERFSLRGEVDALGSKAMERHRVMEEGYLKALEEYLALVEGLQQSATIETQQTLQSLKTLLDKILHKKKTPIIGNLPYRRLNYPSREPDGAPGLKPAYKGGNKVVSDDDLKDTPEAPITEETANLAQSLNWNPVLIYEYVKNEISTEWYWGCMKGAEETLRQKSGNDCDQATLLTALLRASGFPTRYVRGTAEFFAGGKDIVMEKIKNLTGIDDPIKIAEYFQKAGIPYRPVIEGGKITNFQIEHIWVESQIPYSNYRGAIIDDQGKTWLGLDTSIKVKGYAYNSAADIYEQSGAGVLLSAIRDEYLSSVRTETPLEYFEEKLSTLNLQLSTDSYKLTRTIIPEVMHILPASMQFDQKKITHEYTAIPEELKHKVRFVASDPKSSATGALFDITFNTMDLSNRMVALSAEPETVEDQEIIDSYGGLDNTPAYLVKLRPILKVNGELRAAGKDGLLMGEDYDLTIELISPNGTERVTNTQITGNVVVVGITAQRAIGAQLSALSKEDDAEAILFKEANRYIDRWNQSEDELASLLHLNIIRPIPTIVTVGGLVDVTYLLDMPHGFEWKGIFVDAGLRALSVQPSAVSVGAIHELPLQNDRQKTFMQLSALQGSVSEHRILEDDLQVESISTAKLIQTVSDQQSALSGQLLTIDKTNITTVLSASDLDDNIKEDITNTVNQGLIVRMPSADSLPMSAVSYKDWTGTGYIKEDPSTGEAGYMLTGMIAGATNDVSPDKWVNKELAAKLGAPYSGIPNKDPMAAVSIVKVTPTDEQEITVNTKAPKDLWVLVRDKKYMPVKGAEVTFEVQTGGGYLGTTEGTTTLKATTDFKGVARMSFTAGKNIGANPLIAKLKPTDLKPTQIGDNFIMAAITTPSGKKTLERAFEIYGLPDKAEHFRYMAGDGNSGLVNTAAGTIAVRVEDRYFNPVSNSTVSYTVSPANPSDTTVELPPTYRNLKLYTQASCPMSPYITYEDCKDMLKDSLSDISGYDGMATTEALFGDTLGTEYTVAISTEVFPKVTEKNPLTVHLYTQGKWKDGLYIAPLLKAGIYATLGIYGGIIDGAKVNAQLPSPLKVEVLFSMPEYTVENGGGIPYLKGTGRFISNKVTNAVLTPISNKGGATITGIENLNNGTYTIGVKMGSLPEINLIQVDGHAAVTVPHITEADQKADITLDLPLGSDICFKHSSRDTYDRCDWGDRQNLRQLAQAPQKTLYSVLPEVAPPPIMFLSDSGLLMQDVEISYSIKPLEYTAGQAYLIIYENGEVFIYTPANVHDSGKLTLLKGRKFDRNKTYEIELVLNYGSEMEMRSEKKKLLNAALIPDYDRNGVIDDADRERVARGDKFYFWINDDDDGGDTDGSDIPGDKMLTSFNLDYESAKVDGIRDLIDFFPVYLDIKNLLNNYDPAKYAYKLISEDESLNFVLTDLEALHAGYYLRGDDNNLQIPYELGNANTSRINTGGTFLNNHPDKPGFLEGIKSGKKGVVLIEGRKASNKPLELAVYDGNQVKVASVQLNLSISGVEQMFRHKNLTPAVYTDLAPGPGSKAGELDRSDASNCPDVECLGADPQNIKNFIFLHGYNVNGQQARGWQSEMFKRMFWSGSKARFWGVTWYGWDSQEVWGVLPLPGTPNFHLNVLHAFDTVPALRNFLKVAVPGEITIMAHSLGNMVVSAMLTNYADGWDAGGKISNYFMVDAAVASEAYGSSDVSDDAVMNVDAVTNKNMTHPEWKLYNGRLWASEWHLLFDDPDNRRKLTWRNIFKKRPATVKYYNFYSDGEEVLAEHEGIPNWYDMGIGIFRQTGRYSWALQEKLKGVHPSNLIMGSNYGGWGFNNAWDVFDVNITEMRRRTPAETTETEIKSPQLRTMPFFLIGNEANLFREETGSNYALTNMDRLLADAIPARTLAAGRKEVLRLGPINEFNFEMQTLYKTRKTTGIYWPSVRQDQPNWRHSDLREVAYTYLYNIFNKFVEPGGQ